jgi:hypothetical protein
VDQVINIANASPKPRRDRGGEYWRVDPPHNLEHGDGPPAEDSEPLAGSADVPGQSPDEGKICKVRAAAAASVNETLMSIPSVPVRLLLEHPSAGKRIQFSAGKPSVVVDGPFAEAKELVAGFWIWKVKSLEEAVSWARRCPDAMPGEDFELEIRPFFEAEDFGAEFTPELQAQEERLRAQLERQQH